MRRLLYRAAIAVAGFAALAAAHGGRAADLAVDLSDHLIAITAGFSGTDLLLFGATEGEGDVVVVVRGPPDRIAVRRKVRIAGIWVNGPSADFENVPSLYIVRANRPLDDIIGLEMRRAMGIGFDAFLVRPVQPLRPGESVPYREALFRLKRDSGLYSDETGIEFVDGRLFRTNIRFPASVATGDYQVDVYLIRDGRVINSQTTPLRVTKAGVGAAMYDFAHQYSALYGIIAIIMALFAGWLANAMFRRS